MSDDKDDESLAEPVRRHRRRREFWEQHGERSLGRNLAMVGALGWLIVVPTLIGLFLGRWIDHSAESGIFWTVSLLFLGLCIGCWLAWRKVMEP